jgi:hypothetical protein
MIFEINSPRLYEPGPPQRDPKYLNFIRAIGWCLACGRQCVRWSGKPRAQAAHIGPHGLGQKASDYDAVPLCGECHVELSGPGGRVAFEEKWGLCFKDHIKTLNERYRRIRKKAA